MMAGTCLALHPVRIALCFLVLHVSFTTGLCQNLSLKIGTPFRPANAEIVWEAPSNSLPSKARVYHFLPNRPSPQVISNLLALCSLTEKEKSETITIGLFFKRQTVPAALVSSIPSGPLSLSYAKSTLIRTLSKASHLLQRR